VSAGRKAPHYLLDTNTVSYILKGRSSAARARLATLPDHEPAGISAITEAELRYGIVKAGSSPKQRAALEGFLTMVHPVSWDSTAAQAYGELRPQQERLGKPLGNLDLLIAAHAISLGAILVTHDQAFHQIPNLPGLADWATDL
jgi:tRNA(fMet)-specific endonuclease VapC